MGVGGGDAESEAEGADWRAGRIGKRGRVLRCGGGEGRRGYGYLLGDESGEKRERFRSESGRAFLVSRVVVRSAVGSGCCCTVERDEEGGGVGKYCVHA